MSMLLYFYEVLIWEKILYNTPITTTPIMLSNMNYQLLNWHSNHPNNWYGDSILEMKNFRAGEHLTR